MKKRLTPPQIKDAERMRNDGYTVTAIAEKLGVDRHTVSRHLARVGAPGADRTPPNFSTDEVSHLRLLARSFEFFPCAGCGTTIVALKTVERASCPHCGVSYKRNLSSESQRDAA